MDANKSAFYKKMMIIFLISSIVLGDLGIVIMLISLAADTVCVGVFEFISDDAFAIIWWFIMISDAVLLFATMIASLVAAMLWYTEEHKKK